MIHPYWNVGFFQFFIVLFSRIALFITGKLSLTDLAPDEIQIGVLVFTSIAAALIGSLLYLRKMTMLANALSHTILLGLVSAFLLCVAFSSRAELTLHDIDLTMLLLGALITALLTAFCTQWLTKVMHLYADASIGLVFTVFFALGVTLVTLLTKNTHLGIEAIMGNVDALHLHDLKLIGIICLLDILVVLLFFKEWHLTTFDGGLAKALGFHPSAMGYGLMVLTALTAIGAFRAVGVFLVLGLMIFPALIARQFTHQLKKLMWLAVWIGIFGSVFSVAISRTLLSVWDTPVSTAGLLITLLSGSYIIVNMGIKKPFLKRKGCKAHQVVDEP